jgi:hypothetical protein
VRSIRGKKRGPAGRGEERRGEERRGEKKEKREGEGGVVGVENVQGGWNSEASGKVGRVEDSSWKVSEGQGVSIEVGSSSTRAIVSCHSEPQSRSFGRRERTAMLQHHHHAQPSLDSRRRRPAHLDSLHGILD